MKYWAYVNNEILGPFEKEKLLELPSFSPALLICPQTPVGEKTEDWKEASAYPEISAILSPGAQKPAAAEAPAPQAAASPISAAAPLPADQPAHAKSAGIELKPLTAASVEPVPPVSDHSFGQINLEVGHLERSGHTSPAGASAFDPITLSSITRKADGLSAAGPAVASEDGLAREPQPAFGAAAPAAQPIAEPAAAAFRPVQEPVSAIPPAEIAPAQALSAAPAAGGPALDELSRKIDILASNSASRQDITSATEPLRMKLDQMGEVLSSMKNSQFQREIMDKLAYLENAVSDIKFSIKDGGKAAPGSSASNSSSPSPSPSTDKLTFEPNSATVFSVPPPEKLKPEPASSTPADIVDQGVKPSRFKGMLSGFFRKMTQLVLTLTLLLAVLLVSIFALKIANVFDATKFIPFKIPFLSSPVPGEAGQTDLPSNGEDQLAQLKGEPSQAGEQPEANKEPDVSPEVVYFARYYAPVAGGPKLEDKITEAAAADGAVYNPANWQAKSTGKDLYEVAALVPGKTSTITFTFTVDFAKKTITPVDEKGKAAYDALTPPPAQKKARTPRSKRGGAAAAPKRPARTQAAPAKKPAAKTTKITAAEKPGADEDYEYVYEDEEYSPGRQE